MIISAFKILFFTDKKIANNNLVCVESMFQSNYATKTTSVTSIQQAMEVLESDCIHILVSDTTENTSKFGSLIKKCKSSISCSHIYIMYVTSSSDEEFILSMYKHGVSEVVDLRTSESILRARANKLAEHIIRCTNSHHKEELSLDPLLLSVSKGSNTLEFTKKEFDILQLLSNHPNKTFSRSEIYQKVWGNGIIVSDRTLDVHISKIRTKIGEQFIQTFKGVGYRFIPR
jgi:two-component system, OmpR family, alkaline phosphatase synthesis response regulator PhoP